MWKSGCSFRRASESERVTPSGAATDRALAHAVLLRYDLLPPEILVCANTKVLHCGFTDALQPSAALKPIELRQRIPRDHLQLTESMKVTLRRFVRVYETHLGHVGLGRATINIGLDILVPLGFDLKFLEAKYAMDVNEKTVSRGQKGKFLLHGSRWNRLEFPIESEYSQDDRD